MKRWLLVGLVALSCGKKTPPPAEEEEEVFEEIPYEGEASTGIIPNFEADETDAGGAMLVDAGQITIDTRCCTTHFSIADQEPADAVGYLEGEHAAFGTGLPLTRSGGSWTATACFPVKSSAHYWYRFDLDGGFEDAGVVIDREDGGESIVIVHKVETQLRASDREPQEETAVGARNFYKEVPSCEGLDGSVP